MPLYEVLPPPSEVQVINTKNITEHLRILQDLSTRNKLNFTPGNMLLGLNKDAWGYDIDNRPPYDVQFIDSIFQAIEQAYVYRLSQIMDADHAQYAIDAETMSEAFLRMKSQFPPIFPTKYMDDLYVDVVQEITGVVLADLTNPHMVMKVKNTPQASLLAFAPREIVDEVLEMAGDATKNAQRFIQNFGISKKPEPKPMTLHFGEAGQLMSHATHAHGIANLSRSSVFGPQVTQIDNEVKRQVSYTAGHEYTHQHTGDLQHVARFFEEGLATFIGALVVGVSPDALHTTSCICHDRIEKYQPYVMSNVEAMSTEPEMYAYASSLIASVFNLEENVYLRSIRFAEFIDDIKYGMQIGDAILVVYNTLLPVFMDKWKGVIEQSQNNYRSGRMSIDPYTLSLLILGRQEINTVSNHQPNST